MKTKQILIPTIIALLLTTIIIVTLVIIFKNPQKIQKNTTITNKANTTTVKTLIDKFYTPTSTKEEKILVDDTELRESPGTKEKYNVTIDNISCNFLFSSYPNDYYELTTSGTMEGKVGSIGIAESMQSLVSVGAFEKVIYLDCGEWDFSVIERNYACIREIDDPQKITYNYKETYLFYENCPYPGCVDVNENTYFFNSYIYNPGTVTSIYHFRPVFSEGKSIDYLPFTCGGRTGYGLRFID